MKLLFYFIFSLILMPPEFAFAQDGTLPAIRNIDVEIIDGNVPYNPGNISIPIDQRLRVGQQIKEEILIDELEVLQEITLKNQNGKLKVKLKAIDERDSSVLSSRIKKKYSDQELLNEVFFSSEEKIIQHIQVNFK